MPNAARPIAVFHEHPDWFRPLFNELERRGIPYVRLDAAAHRFDPAEREVPYSLVVNRASPSAYLRAHGQTTFYTLHWLKHLERLGVPVVNGSDVYGTALVQESAPLRDGHITRVETLGGKYLYAIDVYPAVGSFDLCPADACQTTSGVELVGGACAVGAPKTGLKVQAANPPAEIIAQVERIAQAATLDIGGIEYLIDDRDGKHY